MRTPLLALTALSLLAACATPREACVADARSGLRTVDRLVEETRANISRGYGLREVQDVRTVRDTCEGVDSEGNAVVVRCQRTVTRTRNEPVAIDLNAERRTLDSLLERQALQRRAAEAAIEQCIRIYPAE